MYMYGCVHVSHISNTCTYTYMVSVHVSHISNTCTYTYMVSVHVSDISNNAHVHVWLVYMYQIYLVHVHINMYG